MSLDLDGEMILPSDAWAVWHAINDPEVLSKCIPGCERLERREDDSFSATVRVKIGPVALTFSGVVRLENAVPPFSFTLVGEGSGGVAGFAKGAADIRLMDTEEGTRLSYSVKSEVGGKIAQLGARLLKGSTQKLIGQFFTELEAHFRAETPVVA